MVISQLFVLTIAIIQWPNRVTGKVRKVRKACHPESRRTCNVASHLTLLPPAPHGFERIEIAGKVLLVEIATQVIHDVLEDVILGK